MHRYPSDQSAYGGVLDTMERSASAPGHSENPMSAQLAASRLDAALEESETQAFMVALKEVIRARGGFTATARKTGLNRTALYKIVSAHGNPALSTLVVLLSVVGLRLSIKPIAGSQTPKPGLANRGWEDSQDEA